MIVATITAVTTALICTVAFFAIRTSELKKEVQVLRSTNSLLLTHVQTKRPLPVPLPKTDAQVKFDNREAMERLRQAAGRVRDEVETPRKQIPTDL